MKTFKQFLKESNDTLYFTFGRFDPPTIGHKKLLDILKKRAGSSDWMVFPSRTTDYKQTFLTPEERIQFMKELYPEYADHIIDDQTVRTPIQVMEKYPHENYVMIVGQPEVEQMSRFIPYAPSGSTLKVYSAGNRNHNPDDRIESMSSSKLKKYVIDGNEDMFIDGIGNVKVGKQIYNILRQHTDNLAKYVKKKGH